MPIELKEEMRKRCAATINAWKVQRVEKETEDKVCPVCGKRMEQHERYVIRQEMTNGGRKRNVYSGLCTTCQSIKGKIKNYEKSFGGTGKRFMELIELQNGKCAICGKLMCFDAADSSYVNLQPVWDHNHDTGESRGVTHRLCNLLFGHADSACGIRAAEYKAQWDKIGTLKDFRAIMESGDGELRQVMLDILQSKIKQK